MFASGVLHSSLVRARGSTGADGGSFLSWSVNSGAMYLLSASSTVSVASWTGGAAGMGFMTPIRRGELRDRHNSTELNADVVIANMCVVLSVRLGGAGSNFLNVDLTTSGGGRSVSRNRGAGLRGGLHLVGGSPEGTGVTGRGASSNLLRASTERALLTASRRISSRITGAGLDTGRGRGARGGRSSKCSREVARRRTEGRLLGASRSARLR